MRISLRPTVEELETTLSALQTLRQMADRAAEKAPDHAGNLRYRRASADRLLRLVLAEAHDAAMAA